MAWNVEGTDQFRDWFQSLPDDVQDDIEAIVGLLEEQGPTLTRPHADQVRDSRHANMKELRVQSSGQPYRVFFAFDPRRSAILLIGGNKVGDHRFYKRFVPTADSLYDEHIQELHDDGLIE
jgi:hypothetical protein